MRNIQQLIENAWETRSSLSPESAPQEVRDAVAQVLARLDTGEIRVAEKSAGQWQVHQWVKKAVLLSFRLEDNQPIVGGELQFYDKEIGRAHV